MFKPGDIFHFKCDTTRAPLTVKGVSPDGLMIESEEYGGWSWADGAILLETAPEPDFLDQQLKFLDL
jgi:hypothetical protein